MATRIVRNNELFCRNNFCSLDDNTKGLQPLHVPNMNAPLARVDNYACRCILLEGGEVSGNSSRSPTFIFELLGFFFIIYVRTIDYARIQ